jgi:hypothetical protein
VPVDPTAPVGPAAPVAPAGPGGPVGPVAPVFSLIVLIWLCRFRIAFQILLTFHWLRPVGVVTTAADAGATAIAIRIIAISIARIFRSISQTSLMNNRYQLSSFVPEVTIGNNLLFRIANSGNFTCYKFTHLLSYRCQEPLLFIDVEYCNHQFHRKNM